MPLYEYECKKCGHRFEKIQKFSDRMVKKCPECGGQVEQMISAPAVQFKGSGWYVTDYAKKSSSQGASGSSESSGSKDKKDSKSDGGSESSSKDSSTKESSSKDSSSKERSSKESSSKETSSKESTRKGTGRHK
jgi:putative FmdB family regulatory protein